MSEHLRTENLLDMSQTIASGIFEGLTYPWEALPKIKDFIIKLGETLSEDVYQKTGENIWVAKSAKVAPTAYLNGPLIICENAEVRHCAFIRGSAIVGAGAVIGNSTELKNCIIFNNAQVPHYNYVGDSILGYKAHLGAGSITSNLKSDKSLVTIPVGDERLETGLKKFGAIVGDNVEVGCNSVLNPGTVVGRNTNIYPLSMVRGYVPEKSIYKKKGEVADKKINIYELLDKLEKALHKDIKIEDWLDSRYDVDDEWEKTYQLIEQIKQQKGYTKQHLKEWYDIKEKAYKIIENKLCVDSKDEDGVIDAVAHYIEEDFGLIFDSLVFGFENEFLKKLINAYSQAIIPDGSIL